jgi:hypothetical protein
LNLSRSTASVRLFILRYVSRSRDTRKPWKPELPDSRIKELCGDDTRLHTKVC